jgi:hypothetical protein
VAFGLLLLVGNFMDSFMEWGLSRGVMLRHFRASLSFWRASFPQAPFLEIWHLNWPIEQLLTGQFDIGGLTYQPLIVLIATSIVRSARAIRI